MTICRPATRRGRTLVFVCLVTAAVGWPPHVLAQDPVDELPLYERSAFDQLVLDEENGSAVIEVFPLDAIDRTRRPQVVGSLEIRRLQDPPDQRYSVNSRHIVRVQLFHFLLLDTAKRLIAEGDTDEAFYYLARLKTDYPNAPGLDALTEEFYFADARNLFQESRYDEALTALDEVFRLNPNRPQLANVLDRVLSEILDIEFRSGRFQSSRRKLEFARRQYGAATLPIVTAWEDRLEAAAAQQLDKARASLAGGDTIKAIEAVRRAREIWPSLNGIDQLQRQLQKQHPRIRVAVTQRYRRSTDQAAYALNWAARRVRPMLAQSLVTFKDFTADGGLFSSRVGSLEVSPNRDQVSIQLHPELIPSTHAILRELLRKADENAADYSPRWAEHLLSVYAAGPGKLEIQLRPSLKPEALIPRHLRDFQGRELLVGNFRSPSQSDDTLVFQSNTRSTPAVQELEEVFFSDPADAAQALLDGEVDAIDRIHPADLERLATAPQVQVVAYRSPTIHGLVLNHRVALLRKATFRRGLLYAIDRHGFVGDELNGKKTTPGPTVISGFAPIGHSTTDPLGYAYDQRIAARDYDPALGLILMRLAMRQLEPTGVKSHPVPLAPEQVEEAATTTDASSGDAALDLPRLVLAFPDSPIATTGAQSIATDLRRVGIAVDLRNIETGRGWPAEDDWDLLYLETTVEDPLADLPNLILNHEILGRHGGLVWQAMRRLQEATNLEQARDHFQRIHKLTYDHTPMLPLWQIIEHAAIGENISGIPQSPISLYDQLPEWRLAP